MFNSSIPVIFLLSLIYSLAHSLAESGDATSTDIPQLPQCPFIDPIEELERWSSFNFSSCNTTQFKPDNSSSSVEQERYLFGENHYSFNVLVSDKLGPSRSLEQYGTHERCSRIEYQITLKASIVIIYHNEAFSVLVRMINSILRETPTDILAEIILYDDFSDTHLTIQEHLKKYGSINKQWDVGRKIRYYRSDKREGLIRAKVFASRLATADVLVFLDSHCEVTPRWIEPLLLPIQENPTRVVLPIVDLIDPNSFEYSKAMVTKGSFDWSLKFSWEYYDWSYFKDEENYVRPFKTVAMSGGLLAIDRRFFQDIGEYDLGMEIWGGENVELSVRVWLCGGSILVAPCSRVGHVFRMRRPYKGKPGVDTSLYNSLRAVNVWFDDYKKYFIQARPFAAKMDPGDLTERMELKKQLNCRPFSWFIDNIHTGLKPADEKLKTEL